MSWFAVGCYYHLTGNYDSARRYFEKSTHIDNWFAPAWLGYGNAFAAQVCLLVVGVIALIICHFPLLGFLHCVNGIDKSSNRPYCSG